MHRPVGTYVLTKIFGTSKNRSAVRHHVASACTSDPEFRSPVAHLYLAVLISINLGSCNVQCLFLCHILSLKVIYCILVLYTVFLCMLCHFVYCIVHVIYHVCDFPIKHSSNHLLTSFLKYSSAQADFLDLPVSEDLFD